MTKMVKSLPAVQETQIRSLGWEDPLEKGMANHSSILVPWCRQWQPTPVFLLGKSHGQRKPSRLAAAANLLQLCLTLCDPIDSSPPGPQRSLATRGEDWASQGQPKGKAEIPVAEEAVPDPRCSPRVEL